MTILGEKLYESDVDITGVTDYGLTLDDVLAGRQAVPPQGARYDLAFAGLVKGRLSGSMRGVDYLNVRADRRMDLGLHGTLETEDGHRIAFSASGVATPRENEPVVDLAVNIRLSTAAVAYAWVNTRQVWGVGHANLATGKVHAEAFAMSGRPDASLDTRDPSHVARAAARAKTPGPHHGSYRVRSANKRGTTNGYDFRGRRCVLGMRSVSGLARSLEREPAALPVTNPHERRSRSSSSFSSIRASRTKTIGYGM